MLQQELLKHIAISMSREGIDYMIVGSISSSLLGEPRATHDIDLVVQIQPEDVRRLAKVFPEPDFDFDEVAAMRAVATFQMCNVLHWPSGDKVDIWPLKPDAYSQVAFSRRAQIAFGGVLLWCQTPEDVIISKLQWAELAGGSEKQMNDARSVLDLHRNTIDMSYLEQWAEVLDVRGLLRQLASRS